MSTAIKDIYTNLSLYGELSWGVRGDTNANGNITSLETDGVSTMYFSGSSPVLCGLVNPDINNEKLMVLFYSGSGTLTIKHQSEVNNVAATSRLILPYDSDITVYPNESAMVFYDSVLERWRFLGKSTLYIPDIISTNEVTVNELRVWKDSGITITTAGAISELDITAQSVVRLTAATSVAGLIADADDSGKLLYLHNASADFITIKNQSSDCGDSTHRIITGKDSDLDIGPDTSIFFQYDGTSARWRVIGGTGTGSGYRDVAKTANYTAKAGERIVADTSGGGFTITLPASPRDGDTVAFLDDTGSFGTNALVVNPNGNTLNGDADSYSLDINKMYVEIHFFDGGWRFLDVPVTTNDGVAFADLIYTGSVDPINSPGVAADPGAIYLGTDGQIWTKYDTGDTDWHTPGAREFNENITYAGWTQGTDYEIVVNHSFGNRPNIQVINDATDTEMICEIEHANNKKSSTIKISSTMRALMFPSGGSSPAFAVTIICK
jgi:hypothetical protein